MIAMKKIILLFLIFTFFDALSLEEPEAKISADSSSTLIGKRINLTMDFISKENYDVIFPAIEDSSEKIELLNISEPDTAFNEDFRTIRRNYVITSFDSGSYDIGPYTFVYSENNSDDFKVVKSNPLRIKFNSVAVDTTQPVRDIKPPINPGWSLSEFLPYIIILIIVIAIFVIYMYSKKKKSTGTTPWIIDKPKIPPHKEALDALEKLRSEQLWQQGKVKEYHIRITNILRNYIERRFGINALEMITDDILNEFEKINRDSELYHTLKDVLTLGDLAKFAKFNPLAGENEKSFDYTFAFVKRTIPVKDGTNSKEEEKDA